MTTAQSAVMAIQKNLTNPLHKAVFGDLRGDVWSESGLKFNISTRPTDISRIDSNVVALGSGSDSLGSHFDLILIDDICGPDDRDYQSTREKNIRYVSDVIDLLDLNANASHTNLLINGTPWHYDDAYAQIIRRAKDPTSFYNSDDKLAAYSWRISVEGVLKDDGSLRYPSLFSYDKLKMLEHEKGPISFASQYLLKNLSASTTVFKPELFHCYTNNFTPGYFVLFIDPSMGTVEGDFSCVVALAVNYDSLGPIAALWEVDMKIRVPSVLMSDLRIMVQKLMRIAPVRLIGIESVGFQALIPDLPMDADEGYLDIGREIKIHRMKIPGNQAKKARILGLEQPIVNGRILFPKGFEVLFPESAKQLCNYTLGGTTLHDDFPDALVGAWNLVNDQNLNRGGSMGIKRKLTYEDFMSGELSLQDLILSGVPEGYAITMKEAGTWIPKREESGSYQLSDVFGGIKVSPTLGTPLRIKNE